jgi:hypothetical protein
LTASFSVQKAIQDFYWLTKPANTFGATMITRKNPIGVHEIINTATPEKMMIIKDKYYYPNNSYSPFAAM